MQPSRSCSISCALRDRRRGSDGAVASARKILADKRGDLEVRECDEGVDAQMNIGPDCVQLDGADVAGCVIACGSADEALAPRSARPMCLWTDDALRVQMRPTQEFQ